MEDPSQTNGESYAFVRNGVGNILVRKHVRMVREGNVGVCNNGGLSTHYYSFEAVLEVLYDMSPSPVHLPHCLLSCAVCASTPHILQLLFCDWNLDERDPFGGEYISLQYQPHRPVGSGDSYPAGRVAAPSI